MTADPKSLPSHPPSNEPGINAGLVAFPPITNIKNKHPTTIIMNHPYLPALQQHCRRESRSLKPLTPLKPLLLLPAAGIFLACASCSDSTPKPPPAPVTDTQPVGEGLKVIGFAMLGAAVVGVLGRMLSKS
jgi:hypothetical protein